MNINIEVCGIQNPELEPWFHYLLCLWSWVSFNAISSVLSLLKKNGGVDIFETLKTITKLSENLEIISNQK